MCVKKIVIDLFNFSVRPLELSKIKFNLKYALEFPFLISLIHRKSSRNPLNLNQRPGLYLQFRMGKMIIIIIRRRRGRRNNLSIYVANLRYNAFPFSVIAARRLFFDLPHFVCRSFARSCASSFIVLQAARLVTHVRRYRVVETWTTTAFPSCASCARRTHRVPRRQVSRVYENHGRANDGRVVRVLAVRESERSSVSELVSWLFSLSLSLSLYWA